jgi:hypothetical protein
MKAKPLKVELEGWGRQCIQGYPCKSAMKGTGKNKDEYVNLKTWHFV